MKKISIIIPINRHSIHVSSKVTVINKITGVFSHIYHDLQKRGIECEVVIVTNDVKDIRLHDIEIFPKMTQIRLYREKNIHKTSDLAIRGISYANFDYIGILGSAAGYSSYTFKKVLGDIDKHIVLAAIKTNLSLSLPFFLRMRISQRNTTLFFPKKLWEIIQFTPGTDAVFLLEFLKRAQEAGFELKKYHFVSYAPFHFSLTRNSLREVSLVTKDFITLLLMKIPPIIIPAENDTSMVNAGLFYKKQKYITHTTLKADQSALGALDQKLILILIFCLFLMGAFFFTYPLLFIQVFIACLSCIYCIDVGFNLYLLFKSFQKESVLSFTDKEIAALKNKTLPMYSILCPLYKEAHILPQFIKGLERLDWPNNKLDVIILLESDDQDSQEALQAMRLPKYIRFIIVPSSFPKTKPKACNYGLGFVKGEYTVIYDAEDIPDPQQLKKAYLGFKKLGPKVACLQAKLNYYNTSQNLLTRFFTAEYSLWFDITLPSLNALHTIIPLGGTSNHFRTDDLRELQAWDPFNVTEDADLGLRLFKLGYHTAVLDSVTLEEGNSQVKNWIRQRSRWIKGYMQTYLVHTKESVSFFRTRGIHAIIFHLVIGGKIAFIVINPILWIVTLLYFTLNSLVGPTIDSLYPPSVLYIAMSSLIFGNSMYLFFYIMGCVKREQWGLIKYTYLVPFYWVLISIAGFMALYQLIFKPFYWEKTVHGLHLKNNLSVNSAFSEVLATDVPTSKK